MLLSGMRVKELPIDTFYGDEICHVDGLRYAWDIIKTTTVGGLQNTSLFYRRKYDLSPEGQTADSHTRSKLEFLSSHSLAVETIPAKSRVLNLGVDGGHVARALRDKECQVTGMDRFPEMPGSPFNAYIQTDLEGDPFPDSLESYDTILLMDTIGRFSDPDRFMQTLAQKARVCPDLKIVAVNGNVAFITNRLLVMLGRFNYGKRGILDLMHRRLFTIATLKKLFDGYGFEIEKIRGIPAPFPLLLGNNAFSKMLLKLNALLILVLKGLFSYQVLIVAKPHPSLGWLLAETQKATRQRQRNPRD